MHLPYADESGTVADLNQQHFVLAGVSLFERQGYWVANALEAIAARFNPADPSAIELHGNPMRSRRGAWHSIPQADRTQAVVDALSIIATLHPKATVFASVIKKSVVSPDDPVDLAFEQVVR